VSTPPATATRAPLAVAAMCAAGGASLVAGLGIWVTDLGPWYRSLKQPWFQPPDTWFGPAWTLIYTLTATAAVRAWRASTSAPQRRTLLGALAFNAVLNVMWSWLFFRARRPDWALAEVVALWLSIVLLIVLAWRSDGTAGLLLVPYAVWVAFAAALNLGVVLLNAPF
jgi:translocator protein